MKKQIRFLKYATLFASVLVLFASCGDDDDDVPVAPTLSIDGDAGITAKTGEPFSVTLTLNAPGGNKELAVYTNGGLLETVDLDADASSFTFNTQNVPADAEEGEELLYQFSLIDQADQESPRVDFTVNAARYDLITIGAESLYNITIPEDGIVTSGTSVKLITGRNYYIDAPLSFENGSSFTIEEGVNVYLDVPTEPDEDRVEIILNAGVDVSIMGTSSAPVVMTPSSSLTGTPEPEDWNRLFLDGITNAEIRYLRTEYADDGLRVRGLDDSNTLEYIQTFKPGDEGFYITDGNVNAKYLVVTDCADDGFRIGDAYAGRLQFGIGQMSEAPEDDFHLVEIRETSKPILANFTLVGPGKDAGDVYAYRFTATSDGRIYNSIASSFSKRGVRIAESVTVGGTLDGPTVFAYGYIFDLNEQFFRDDTPNGTNPFQGSMDGDTFLNPFFNNVTGFDTEGRPIVETIDGIGVNDFIPAATVTAKESFDPSTIDSFFSSVTYVGAIENESGDWTTGWVKNPDGTIR
ncbi:MAG: hypothetical protein MJA30_28880 [Cytophagales bacterium]|nr:hypothetical protein [Cytophagales bacterium]